MKNSKIFINNKIKLEPLNQLEKYLKKPQKEKIISFNDFLNLAIKNPKLVFRNIFQLFYDMIFYFVKEKKVSSNNFFNTVEYDSYNLFIQGCEEPFFPDKQFLKQFINLVKGFKTDLQSNRIYLFEGPPGSGKSKFLNNLLYKLELYSSLFVGSFYQSVWKININELTNKIKIKNYLIKLLNENNYFHLNNKQEVDQNKDSFLYISCPYHDHPILQIPKNIRSNFLNELFFENDFKKILFNDKSYSWIFTKNTCSICKLIYNLLLEYSENPLDPFKMLTAKRMIFDRQFSEGIDVYNPSDKFIIKSVNKFQNLNTLFMHNNKDKLSYSNLAKINNGLLVLMDLKEHNIDRFRNLHSIISDGIHKIDFIEEPIRSLFFGIVNPEDQKHFSNIKSFQDRIMKINISYVLDYNIEVLIYHDQFGKSIKNKFLPGVLESFAKIIISSRLEKDFKIFRTWINPEKYKKYLDSYFFLLKMDLYAGKLPIWLSEEDIKRFDYNTAIKIFAEFEHDGRKGISGRQSLSILNDFLIKHQANKKLITIEMVRDFFMKQQNLLDKYISPDLIHKLIDTYDFNVLQEIKESIYYYNEKQIYRDIQNYLFCINFDLDETVTSCFTGDKIKINEEFLSHVENLLLGYIHFSSHRLIFRKDIHKKYVSKTLAQEIKLEGKKLVETEQFKELFNKYVRNLKSNALLPYIDKNSLKYAIQDYNTSNFKKYDNRLKQDVNLLMKNLQCKFKYSVNSAREISLYVLDKNINQKFT